VQHYRGVLCQVEVPSEEHGHHGEFQGQGGVWGGVQGHHGGLQAHAGEPGQLNVCYIVL
jgi:hypothetical protein